MSIQASKLAIAGTSGLLDESFLVHM